MGVISFRRAALHLAMTGVLALLLLPAPAQTERRLTIYTLSTVYSVPLTNRGGQEYVSLSEVLEPLGNVEAKTDGRKWKLRFSSAGKKEIASEFADGKNTFKLGGRDIPLAGNFFMENGRGYIPLHDAGDVVAVITGQITRFRESSARLMLGNAGNRYTLDLRIGDVRTGAPPRLVLSFQAPVSPAIANEPGRVRLSFRRDPVVPAGPENATLGNPLIMSAMFSDSTGMPQITVNSTVPLLTTLADGNKTIILTPAQTSAQASPTPAPSATPAAANTVVPGAAPPVVAVIIDAAHGGDDRGAAITPTLSEKEITLTLARRLQHELQNRGVSASLLRQGDSAISLDDRAVAANASKASLYINVHASSLGNGVRVFTAMMSPAGAQARRFVPFETAQAGFLDLSSQAAGSVATELGNRKIAVAAFPAPLRPMRNVAAPAIAIEVAPPAKKVEQISSTEYQQSVAAAIAQGIVAVRSRLAGAR